jgi:hypothetical protein
MMAAAGTNYVSRCFGVPVDFHAYEQWELERTRIASRDAPAPSHGPEGIVSNEHQDRQIPADGVQPSSQPSADAAPSAASAPYPLSFNHVVELIAAGQPIPGIKEIPDTVLEGQASESVKAKRKKPWEKD